MREQENTAKPTVWANDMSTVLRAEAFFYAADAVDTEEGD